MRSDDPGLRGTALEYLEIVLPPQLRRLILPLLGQAKQLAGTRPRGARELADELLRSSASLGRPLK